MIESLFHYGDMLAIPFFVLLSVYFYRIKRKTPFEWLLFIFSLSGVFIDIFFTYVFLNTN